MSAAAARAGRWTPSGPGWVVGFTALFVVLIGTGIGLRLWTAERQQDESERLARRWSAAEVDALSHRVRSRLDRAERVLMTLAEAARLDRVDAEPRDRAAAMAAYLPGFSSFAFVYAGLPDGSSYGAQRLLSGRIELFTRRPGEPAELWAVESGALSAKPRGDPVPFDPRRTPWFRAAREADHIVWSQPYTGLGASSIVTASLDVGDRVYGLDVSLAGIAEAISTGRIASHRSSVYILNREKNPITGLARSAGRGHQAALDLFLRSGPADFERLHGDAPTVRSFTIDSERFVGAIRPLRLGRELLGAVVLITPGEEVSPAVELPLINSIALGFVLVGLLCGVAAMASLAVGLSFAGGDSAAAVEPEAAAEPAADDAREGPRQCDWPARLLACIRDSGDAGVEELARQAERADFQLAGRMPERLLLRAESRDTCRALVDWALARTRQEGCAVGLAYESDDGAAASARLAESLASTPGVAQASQRLADNLGAEYAVRRRGRVWLDAGRQITVFTIEVGA